MSANSPPPYECISPCPPPYSPSATDRRRVRDWFQEHLAYTRSLREEIRADRRRIYAEYEAQLQSQRLNTQHPDSYLRETRTSADLHRDYLRHHTAPPPNPLVAVRRAAYNMLSSTATTTRPVGMPPPLPPHQPRVASSSRRGMGNHHTWERSLFPENFEAELREACSLSTSRRTSGTRTHPKEGRPAPFPWPGEDGTIPVDRHGFPVRVSRFRRAGYSTRRKTPMTPDSVAPPEDHVRATSETPRQAGFQSATTSHRPTSVPVASSSREDEGYSCEPPMDDLVRLGLLPPPENLTGMEGVAAPAYTLNNEQFTANCRVETQDQHDPAPEPIQQRLARGNVVNFKYIQPPEETLLSPVEDWRRTVHNSSLNPEQSDQRIWQFGQIAVMGSLDCQGWVESLPLQILLEAQQNGETHVFIAPDETCPCVRVFTLEEEEGKQYWRQYPHSV